MIIHIDPGTAFGTGMHETTQLCIRQLRKHVTDHKTLLDVGTGSGILSLLAFKFGAKSAIGTDLDICTIDAVKATESEWELANATLNNHRKHHRRQIRSRQSRIREIRHCSINILAGVLEN